MSELYEEFHRIVERVMAGKSTEKNQPAGRGDGLQANEAMRAAFVRVIREELELPDKP